MQYDVTHPCEKVACDMDIERLLDVCGNEVVVAILAARVDLLGSL